MPKKNRRIAFYRVRPQIMTSAMQLVPGGSMRRAFGIITRLPPDYQKPASRYQPLADGNEVYIAIDDDNRSMVRGQFALKRLENLAPIEKAGQLSELKLGGDEGLAEIRHFVYWKQTDVLGIEYNHFGPRMRQLANYFGAQCSGVVDYLDIELMLGGDSLAKIRSMNQPVGIRFSVASSAVSQLPHIAPGLFKPLRELRKHAPNSATLTVEVGLDGRAARKSHQQVAGWRDEVVAAVEDDGLREQITTAEVRGYDHSVSNRLQYVDALADRLQTVVSIPLIEGSNQTLASSAYAAIVQAHLDLDIAQFG